MPYISGSLRETIRTRTLRLPCSWPLWKLSWNSKVNPVAVIMPAVSLEDIIAFNLNPACFLNFSFGTFLSLTAQNSFFTLPRTQNYTCRCSAVRSLFPPRGRVRQRGSALEPEGTRLLFGYPSRDRPNYLGAGRHLVVIIGRWFLGPAVHQIVIVVCVRLILQVANNAAVECSFPRSRSPLLSLV